MVRTILLLALLAMLPAGCDRPAGRGETAILWIQPMRDHPVHRLMQAGFLDRCRELRLRCDVVGNASATNYDVIATLSLAEAALSRRDYGAVAVYTADPSINAFIARLAREKLPVLTWHDVPKEGSIAGLSAAVGQDVPLSAANAARAIGERMRGRGTIAVTQGAFNAHENEVVNAFDRTLRAAYPGIKVLPPQLEGFEPSAARAKAVALLQGNPAIGGVFSTTGNGAQTWSGAARTAARPLVIVGMDYIRQNLDLVRDGVVFAVVGQPLFEEGAKTAELGAALAERKPVAYRNYLPATIVTRDRLMPFYTILTKAGQ